MWTIPLAPWGELIVHTTHDVPGSPQRMLHWHGTGRRLVEVASQRGGPGWWYVASWPTGQTPQSAAPSDVNDLRGLAICQPVIHRCAVCDAKVPGLYVDSGLPFFKPFEYPHAWLERCPSCAVDRFEARLTGLLV